MKRIDTMTVFCVLALLTCALYAWPGADEREVLALGAGAEEALEGVRRLEIQRTALTVRERLGRPGALVRLADGTWRPMLTPPRDVGANDSESCDSLEICTADIDTVCGQGGYGDVVPDKVTLTTYASGKVVCSGPCDGADVTVIIVCE